MSILVIDNEVRKFIEGAVYLERPLFYPRLVIPREYPLYESEATANLVVCVSKLILMWPHN